MTPTEIQSIREARGWTQQELADACGVDISTAQRWLSGKTKPSGSACVLLARFRDEILARETAR